MKKADEKWVVMHWSRQRAVVPTAGDEKYKPKAAPRGSKDGNAREETTAIQQAAIMGRMETHSAAA